MFDEKSHSLKMDKSIEAFSKELSRLKSASQALSANILGAMLGGFLEYNSMYFGFSSLYFLGGFLYLLAFLFYINNITCILTPMD